jgi:hypothetical protein
MPGYVGSPGPSVTLSNATEITCEPLYAPFLKRQAARHQRVLLLRNRLGRFISSLSGTRLVTVTMSYFFAAIPRMPGD